jgi:biotin transporter BioY
MRGRTTKGLPTSTVVSLRPARQRRRAAIDDAAAVGLGDPPSQSLGQRLAYPPRVSLNGLLLAGFAAVLLLMSGFLTLALPNPLQWGTPWALQAVLPYTLQLPLALSLGVFLGPIMGVGFLALYIVVGLCGIPIFANGGGLGYVLQPGFGYWLAVLLVCAPLAQRFHRFCLAERHSIWRVLKQGLVSMLIIHALGATYLICLSLGGQIPAQDIPGWLSRLSLEPLPYDCLAALLGLSLVRPLRLLCWWILY